MGNTHEELTRLSDLIGLIYEGTTLPGRWTESILPAIARYIQAPECILFTPSHTPQNGGYFFMHGIAQDHIDLYLNKYIHADVWVRAGAERNLFLESNIIIGEELVPREQLLQSVIYKEYLCRDPNMAQLLSSVIFAADSADSVPTVCSFFRGFHHPAFGEQERERMRLILPHLSRSLGVMQRLHTAELTMASTLAAFNRLSTGVLLIDATGEARFINQAAERMLDNSDGLRLNKRPRSAGLGQLSADSPLAQRALSAALRTTLTCDPCGTEHFSDSVIIPRSLAKTTYTLQFSALGGQNEFGASNAFAAIVFVTDGDRQVEVDPAWLENAYGLTPTEARVANVMLECGATQEVANYCNISLHTVRAHLKQIYAKLGVDTRARFVKLMLGLAGISGYKAPHLSNDSIKK
jgi:DNA-binding CsgD family transcriptional regulator